MSVRRQVSATTRGWRVKRTLVMEDSAAGDRPTVPVAANGLEGWTSCCDASVTFHDVTLCCKACWREVAPVTLDARTGRKLDAIVMAVIDGDMCPNDGVAAQKALLAGILVPEPGSRARRKGGS